MPQMDENFIKKIQPHSEEAERSVLGSMLMDRDAIVEAEDILVPEDFYQRQYGILFAAMVELYHEGKPVDLITLQNKLKGKDLPENMTSLDAILPRKSSSMVSLQVYSRMLPSSALR